MKRWTLVLFLLLVPFTMAPRTSLNPGSGSLDLTGIVSRTQVRPGSAVTFVVQARNVSDATMERAHVNLVVGWDGKSDLLTLLASQSCTLSGDAPTFTASCPLGELEPGEKATVRVTARPLVGGLLTFQAVEVSGLGPVPADRMIEVFVRGRG